VKVLFTSGRDSKYREPTIRFLNQYFRTPNERFTQDAMETAEWNVIPYELFMRPEGDMRKDSIVKTEIFDQRIRDKYNVVFAVDDRNAVVDNWREMGLCCVQVAPGNF